MLTSELTSLRAIERGDLPQLLKWRNQPHFRRLFREHRELNMAQQERWFEQTVLTDPRVRMFAIIENERNLLSGACGLCYIDWVNRSADFSIYLGLDDLYIDDRYAPDAAKLMLTYGFNELGLHRMWAEVYDFDLKKRRFFEGLNFTVEGRHRETTWTEGGWRDSLFYGLLESEWKAQQKTGT